jgi:hypothetical protein
MIPGQFYSCRDMPQKKEHGILIAKISMPGGEPLFEMTPSLINIMVVSSERE